MTTDTENKEKRIKANPTKDFFVNMITRDIGLLDCIFDLLDNAIDGARRLIDYRKDNPFSGFSIELNFDRDKFTISDNCGGITLSDAINYAFHFGRNPDRENDVKGGIGLYGIGMKRAIFKIGRKADVVSHAEDASFCVSVDVDRWLAEPQSWDFVWDDVARSKSRGTTITINSLNSGIGDSFADPAFKNELLKTISRDYTFFLEKGLSIKIDDTATTSFKYALKEGDNIAPGYQVYEDDGVSVRVIAGLIEDLPDEIPDEVKPGLVDRFGWYVICNDRVVLAGDKSDKTVWGNDNFQVWHPQYTGFGGFVFFQSDDQSKLPWTTTKRDLDSTSPLYRRSIIKMKALTEDFIKYTNRRKAELDEAKKLERDTRRVDVYSMGMKPEAIRVTPLKLPTLSSAASAPEMITISYKRKKSEIDEIRRNEGNPLMPAKEVGNITFDYYRKMELGK